MGPGELQRGRPWWSGRASSPAGAAAGRDLMDTSRACRPLAPILQRQAGPSRFISPYITAVPATEGRAGSAALPRALPPGGEARPAALHVRPRGGLTALTARGAQAPA